MVLVSDSMFLITHVSAASLENSHVTSSRCLLCRGPSVGGGDKAGNTWQQNQTPPPASSRELPPLAGAPHVAAIWTVHPAFNPLLSLLRSLCPLCLLSLRRLLHPTLAPASVPQGTGHIGRLCEGQCSGARGKSSCLTGPRDFQHHRAPELRAWQTQLPQATVGHHGIPKLGGLMKVSSIPVKVLLLTSRWRN